MKKKISKIWSIGLTFMLAVSLLLVAAPGMTVSAADPVINEWDEFAFPDPGEEGDWVWDPDIGAIGPIAEAINGDLYAYADVDVDDVASDDQLFKSTDGGRTWELTKYSDPDDGVVGGRVIDMVCSSLDADTLYVTDGNYVYKTDDGGDEWTWVAEDALETALLGECGPGAIITGEPISCIDVGYQDEDPLVFIGTTSESTAARATGTSTIPAGVTGGLNLDLNIDGIAITLDYTDSTAALVADDIATTINAASGRTVNVTPSGANLTFTNRVVGTVGNRTVAMTDNSYYNGNTVPAITMTGGIDPTPQVDTVTPIPASLQTYNLSITVGVTVYDFSYPTGALATAAEISAALTALVNAHATIPVTAADLIGTFTLTADVAGIAGGFTSASLGPGVLTIVTTAATEAFAAVTIAISPGVTPGLNLGLNIDGIAITLDYTDSTAALVAAKIATAVTAGGTLTTATAAGAVVTFTARVAGTAANGALPMTDASYYNGLAVPAVTLTGGSGVARAGTVYYLDEEEYGADWIDMDLSCEYSGYDVLSVGCAPDFEDSEETYVVISDGSETHVIYTDGGICEWTEFAELLWNCVTANSFGSVWASRIAFPDDWEDAETLFVGVVDVDVCVDEDDPPDDQGGDVYSVTDGEALDRNVRPGEGGCEGKSTDIWSLDFCGDTDSGSVVAGASCDTTVYYSSDGGWEWDPSIKDPTGEFLTYAIWIGDCGESALAATAGCESAVSLTCVSEEEDAEDVGMSWNQISLIAMTVDCVTDLDHSPGYITDSETMFMVTWSEDRCWDYDLEEYYDTTSLFRYDGTYWDRVFSNTTYEADFQGDYEIQAVQVSPDFLDTETVYVTNDDMDIFRSQDAGCSWDRLGYPCDPTQVTSWAVLDEDTVYVGTDGKVLMTDRGGSRSWEECVVEDEDDGIGADLIVYFAFDITDDTTTILVGSQTAGYADYQVFLCEVDPDEDWEDQEWHLVGDCEDVLENGGTVTGTRTSVAFDPGYAVTDDAGENMIYAAAGEVIARCIIDWDEDWEDQEWTEIYDDLDKAWGMKVVGDTVLYVGDADSEDGMVRSLNPTEEDEDDIEFNRVAHFLDDSENLNLRQLTAGENGCPDSNVLWATNVDTGEGACAEVWFYEDTLATPVILIGPADGAQIGKTDEVTLEWEAFCDAESYEIELYRYCAECPDEEEYIDLRFDDDDCFECDIDDCVGCSDETCCLFISGYQYIEINDDIILVPGGMLEPGETYYWSVRVCAIEGEDEEPLPMLSKWSEEQMFMTEMTAVEFWELCSPECGGDDIIITPNFSWDDVSDATSYEVQLATNEDFDPVLASGTPTVNAWLGAPELDYGTTYYWRVRAVKDGITSDWVTCIFTTMAEPVKVYTCPLDGLQFATQAELAAHNAAVHPLVTPTTPAYIWVIIAVGALLVVAMLILIVRTRRVV